MSKPKVCHKCGQMYTAWRCPKCYKRRRSLASSGSTFRQRGGAASVLGHSSNDLDQPVAHWTQEKVDKLADRLAEIFVEQVKALGGKAEIVSQSQPGPAPAEVQDSENP